MRIGFSLQPILTLGAYEVISANSDKLDYSGYKPTYRLLESYDHLIDRADSTIIKYGQGGLQESLKILHDYVVKYSYQVRKLTKHLAEGLDLKTEQGRKQLAFNAWHFCKHHINYAYDAPGKEQLRTPARTYRDRFTGLDCDDYAIFCSCIFREAGLPWKCKIVAFKYIRVNDTMVPNTKPYKYSHIYAMMNNTVVDPVMSKYGMDPPHIISHFSISENNHATALNGIIEINDSDTLEAIEGIKRDLRAHRERLISRLKLRDNDFWKMRQRKKELRKTNVALAFGEIAEPEEFTALMGIMPHVDDIGINGHLVFKDPLVRGICNLEFCQTDLSDAQLGRVEPALCALEVCAGVLGESDYSETEVEGLLGMLSGKRKEKRKAKKEARKQAKAEGKSRKQAKQAGKAAAKTVKAKYAKEGSNKQQRLTTKAKILKAKSTGDKEALKAAKKERRERIKENAKKIGRVLLKIDPVMGIARGSYLAALKVNFLGHATQITWAVANDPERTAKIKKKWTNMGGKWERLVKVAKSAANKKPLFKKNGVNLPGQTKPIQPDLNGLGDLGVAPAFAAAAGIIASITTILGKIFKGGKIAAQAVKGIKKGVDVIKQFTGSSAPAEAEQIESEWAEGTSDEYPDDSEQGYEEAANQEDPSNAPGEDQIAEDEEDPYNNPPEEATEEGVEEDSEYSESEEESEPATIEEE